MQLVAALATLASLGLAAARSSSRLAIDQIDKHPGSFDIVHLTERESKGDHEAQSFCTRIGNVFMLGKGDKPWVTLGFDKGIRPTIFEDSARRLKRNQLHH